MKSKQEIEDKIKELELIRNKAILNKNHLLVGHCDTTIHHLKWILEE